MNRIQNVVCNCTHAHQDELYGKGHRVTTPANTWQKDRKIFVVCCTVCGKEHTLGRFYTDGTTGLK